MASFLQAEAYEPGSGEEAPKRQKKQKRQKKLCFSIEKGKKIKHGRQKKAKSQRLGGSDNAGLALPGRPEPKSA